ncbi:MAG: SpoIID/LytB domain-containing protein [Vicinamibacteria bacterium]
MTRRTAVLAAFAAFGLAAVSAKAQRPDPAAVEALHVWTLEQQGGASHASGQRPELGPTLLADLVAGDARTLRVGLTPSAFAADGSLRLEYDTAAAHNHARVEIGGSGAFELYDAGSGELLAAGGAGDRFTVERAGASLAVRGPLGALAARPGPLRFRPATPDLVLHVFSMRRVNRLLPLVGGSFPLTEAAYRGELEVRASEADATALRLVNLVEVEPYVAGVVVNESLSSFHVEALKAQAVAARGYALANRGRFESRGFDVDDSTLSQVYRGQASETPEALAAQGGTEGLVATRDGRILQALYSSSMGGHSEDNEWIFPAGGLPGTNADPALRAVHDSADPLPQDLSTEAGVLAFYTTLFPGAYEVSQASGGPLTSLHRWTRTRSAAELLARLEDPSRGWGVPATASSIRDLRVTLRGSSGRMMQLVVEGDWGSTTIGGWSDLRALATLAGVTPGGTSTASAPNSPSACVTSRDASGALTQLTFHGGGFGHNVGMSQYGAQGRALRGADFAQILSGYYTGVELGSAPFLLSAVSPTADFELLRGGAGATLVIEAIGRPALELRANGRALRIDAPEDALATLRLGSAPRDSLDRLQLRLLEGGSAIVRLRLERR